MKKILLTSIVFIFVAYLKVNAQQEPQLTHYMFNNQVFNPGATGFDLGFCTITGVFHDQWTDFKDPDGAGAPLTQTASIDYTLPIELQNHMKIAIGAHAVNDREAFFTGTGFMFSGALHMPTLGKNIDLHGDLSIGINAGIINKAVDGSHWVTPDHSDPLLPGTISNAGLDAGIGIMYRRPQQFYVGISALHLPASQIDWTSKNGGTNYTVDRTYFVTGGYYYDIQKNPDLELQPSILVKTDFAKTSFGFSTLFLYKQRYWGGLGVRTENVTALALMLGLQIPGKKESLFRAGYSYDLATQVPTPFGGTHELFLSYRFRVETHVEPPIWDKTPRWL